MLYGALLTHHHPTSPPGGTLHVPPSLPPPPTHTHFPPGPDTRAFVITLGRAGEDNKSFRITDTDATFSGFAGADYNLQDALSNANSIDKKEVEVDGNTFYQFDIDSPVRRAGAWPDVGRSAERQQCCSRGVVQPLERHTLCCCCPTTLGHHHPFIRRHTAWSVWLT
jgi:hypothetical protein